MMESGSTIATFEPKPAAEAAVGPDGLIETEWGRFDPATLRGQQLLDNGGWIDPERFKVNHWHGDDPPLRSDENPKSSPSRPRLRPIAFRHVSLSTTAIYLVKGIIPREALVVIWGLPKCGKSFWAYDLAMTVARGLNYRGRRVIQGPVAYVACEGGIGFGARIEAYRRHHDIGDQDIAFALIPDAFRMLHDHSLLIEEILGHVGDERPVLVVIDTLNRSIDGSESSDEDMGNYIAAADIIRETLGCTVLVVHHCGVAGDRPRGHTSLTGAADCQIAVTRDTAGTILCEVEAMKDGLEGDVIASRLEVVEVGIDDDGDEITSCVIVEAETPKAPKAEADLTKNMWTMLSLLRDAGPEGMTTDAWNAKAREEGLGVKRRSDLYDLRTGLRDRKLIHQCQGRWFCKPQT